jgi:hypothetical protein
MDNIKDILCTYDPITDSDNALEPLQKVNQIQLNIYIGFT